MRALRQDDWREVAEPAAGDAALLRVGGHPIHVGLVVAPGRMLHIERDVNACVERFDGLKWSRRLAGFYRWEGARC